MGYDLKADIFIFAEILQKTTGDFIFDLSYSYQE